MIADRVKETTTTTGTGSLTLGGATAQFQSFNAAFGTGAPFYYVITDANGADWEVGTGELSNATTLVRTTVHQSSNSDNKVNLSVGTHVVFCSAPEVFLSGLAPKSGKLSQFAATTSSELAGVISDETGSGALVFSTSPSLTTPDIGAATATSVNGTTIPSSKTLVVTTDKLSALAATTSAELAGVISDETGSGSLVFATSPSLTTPNIGTPSAGTLTNCTGLPVGGVSGLGTGVETALAVNAGTAGAVVVNGGALGTPSSGTVTNLTGTASININGTVGATTPTTGAFTTVSASGVATFSAGTASAPAITTSGDTNNGIFFPATDATAITTAGSERVRVDSSGNVGIGTSSPGAKLDVNGNEIVLNGAAAGQVRVKVTNATTSGNANSAFLAANDAITQYAVMGWRSGTFTTNGNRLPNSGFLETSGNTNGLTINTLDATPITLGTNNTERLRIDSSGNVGIGTSSPGALFHANGTIRYTNRPAAGTITAIGYDTNGDLTNSSSSLRYKHDINDYEKGLADVMQLRPVSFKFNGEDRENIGFIAEEVDALGLREVMLYDEQDRPDGVLYANMVALLTKAIQEQQRQIDALKAALKGH